MVDKVVDGASLRRIWTSLGQRVAAAGGAFVALYALLHHVPPSTAALRGGAAWLALLVAVRLGGWALATACRLDEEAGLTGPGAERSDETSNE